MVVGERIVVDAVVYLRVGITSSFGAELPNSPVFAMFFVEELNKRVERITVGALRIGATRA